MLNNVTKEISNNVELSNSVEQCLLMLNKKNGWKMSNNVKQCQIMLCNVKQCHTMWNNVSNNVKQFRSKCRTKSYNVEQC